jgi:hypothetical protein
VQGRDAAGVRLDLLISSLETLRSSGTWLFLARS